MKNIYKKAYDDLNVSDDFKKRTMELLDAQSEGSVKEKRPKMNFRRLAAAAAVLVVALIGITAGAKILAPKGANKESAYDSAQNESNTGVLRSFSSYDELYEYFTAQEKNTVSQGTGATQNDSTDRGYNFTEKGEGETEGISSDASSEESAYTGSYEKGDIVKTDGEYIYYASVNTINVFKADGAESFAVSKINIADDGEYENFCLKEIYLSGDTLVVVADSGLYYGDVYRAQGETPRENTTLLFFDINDKTNPVFKGSSAQDGYYLSSCEKDGYIYVVSDYGIYGDAVKEDTESFVPWVYDGDSKTAVDINDIRICNDAEELRYTLISSFNIKTKVSSSSTAVIGGGSDVFFGENAVYISGIIYYDEVSEPYTEDDCQITAHCVKTYTSLTKVNIADGNLDVAAYTEFYGVLYDSRIDEYDGFVRILADIADDNFTERVYANGDTETTIECTNVLTCLYVFDGNLLMTSKIDDVLYGGEIYGICFSSENAYVCGMLDESNEFLNIDMSDPYTPYICGKTELSGMYSVLRKYSDGRVLALGNSQAGDSALVQIAMLDISDKNEPAEKDIFVTENSYSDALYDINTLSLCPKKSLFALPLDGSCTLCTYDDKSGFGILGKLPESPYGGTRGLFIEDMFYIINAGEFSAYETDSCNLLFNCKY